MPKEMTLSGLFTRRGMWWLPSTPSIRVPGTMTYNPDIEINLDLDGTLRQNMPKGTFEHLQVPVILGETLDGKCCTMVDAHESNYQISSPGGVNSSFFCFQLFVGHKHVDPTVTEYESALVSLTDLGGWVNRNPFTDQNTFGQKDGASAAVAYVMPPIIAVTVLSLEAVISIESSFDSNMGYHARILRHSEFLRITPRAPKKSGWYLAALFKFRTLLSLLVGRPTFFLRIQLCTDANAIPELDGKVLRDYVDVCVRQSGQKKEKELLPPQIPFTYPAVASIWSTILNTWYDKSSGLETLVGLVFGISINRGTPVEFQFLALIQAIESYHRTRGSDSYVSDADYEPIRKTLIDAIPSCVGPDHRDALKVRIKYGNEYSLRKRLEMTLDNVPPAIAALITKGDNVFVSRVVDTRNYLTHRDETQKDNVLDLKGMFDATVRLKLLAEFLILRGIGIPVDSIVTEMTTHWYFKNRPGIL